MSRRGRGPSGRPCFPCQSQRQLGRHQWCRGLDATHRRWSMSTSVLLAVRREQHAEADFTLTEFCLVAHIRCLAAWLGDGAWVKSARKVCSRPLHADLGRCRGATVGGSTFAGRCVEASLNACRKGRQGRSKSLLQSLQLAAVQMACPNSAKPAAGISQDSPELGSTHRRPAVHQAYGHLCGSSQGRIGSPPGPGL